MTNEIEQARKRIEKRWADQGECRSCGWHAALHEHDIDDSDIEEALDGDGVLRLSCLSDYDDRSEHRGVRVDIT